MPQVQAQQAHAEPNYMAIWGWLAALTVIELIVAYLPLTKFAIVAMLVVLAFTKAALVALYFMHLKFERRTLMLIAVTPVLLCVFLMFMLVPDKIVNVDRSVPMSTQATTAH
jgi:cytochrome c oxidase subunit 4